MKQTLKIKRWMEAVSYTHLDVYKRQLLVPVDAAFKEWVNKYTFLSRFTFVLYGLSVVAVAVAFQSMAPLLLTLFLGALLYGWMTWRYRTCLLYTSRCV